MRFELLNDRAKIPTRGSEGSAGLDLYASCEEEMFITPGQIVRIPLGIASEFPRSFVAFIKDRSSMAAKGLSVLGGVIDSDYRGPWSVVMSNVGADTQLIKPGDRIAQAVMVVIGVDPPMQVESVNDTARGVHGFGSTGR